MTWLLEPNTKGIPVLRWSERPDEEREWARTEILLTRLARLTEEAAENVRAAVERRAPQKAGQQQVMMVPEHIIRQMKEGMKPQ